jgi:hypothetical protein
VLSRSVGTDWQFGQNCVPLGRRCPMIWRKANLCLSSCGPLVYLVNTVAAAAAAAAAAVVTFHHHDGCDLSSL